MVLVVQVRSSVMCTPRNLVLLTLSTVELSMVSGGVVSGVPPPEVHHNLLCSSPHLGTDLLTPHHSASCATSSL